MESRVVGLAACIRSRNLQTERETGGAITKNLCSVCRLRLSLHCSRSYEACAERLADTWRDTPTKWYPLPIAVGALLLVVVQWRKTHFEQEVTVDEQGREVARLKGPWQVRLSISDTSLSGFYAPSES